MAYFSKRVHMIKSISYCIKFKDKQEELIVWKFSLIKKLTSLDSCSNLAHSDSVKVSEKGGDGGWLLLAWSGRQPSEGKEELGEVVVYFDPGGGGSKGVGAFFQGGDSGGVVVREGDV